MTSQQRRDQTGRTTQTQVRTGRANLGLWVTQIAPRRFASENLKIT